MSLLWKMYKCQFGFHRAVRLSEGAEQKADTGCEMADFLHSEEVSECEKDYPALGCEREVLSGSVYRKR